MKSICIIIPIYNEEESLPFLKKRLVEIIKNIKNYKIKVLFINDGSSDSSLEIIKDIRENDKTFNYISFSRNFGKETAIIAGLDYSNDDAVIIMDADLQDPPELIPELIEYWEAGYDDVYAQRRTRDGETFLKKWTSKMYYKILQKFTNVPIQKDTGDFRLLDRRCVNAICKLRENGRCSKSIFNWIGYKKKAVLFDREKRIAGKTKWNYKKLINLAIDGITSLSISPLRWASYIAIPIFAILLIYFIYVIVKSISLNVAIQAFQAIILLVLFFGGLQVILIGILGEYLGRIFNETKNRPLYLVDEYNEIKERNEDNQYEIKQKNNCFDINDYYNYTNYSKSICRK